MSGLNVFYPPYARLRAATDTAHKRLALKGRVLAVWWRRRFASFGSDTILMPPAWLDGAHKISIGSGTLIHAGSWLAAESSTWTHPGPAIVIGDGVVLGRAVAISASERVIIGNGVGIAGGSLLIDSDHSWDGGRPQVWTNPSQTAAIVIGDYSWLGDGCKILKGVRLGKFCIVAAGSVVRDSHPDLTILAGAPARVVGSARDRMSPELLAKLDAGEI